MKEKKQVQTATPETPTTTPTAPETAQSVPAKPVKLKYLEWLQEQKGVYRSGDIYVLPHVKVGRNEFTTNAGDVLYGYFIPVTYHGQQFDVRLSTPTSYNPNTKKNNIDRGGYLLLDALYSTCSQLNLGIQYLYYPDSTRVRGLKYFVCGYDDFGNIDYLPVDVDKASSESVLRSHINRLRVGYDLELPEF